MTNTPTAANAKNVALASHTSACSTMVAANPAMSRPMPATSPVDRAVRALLFWSAV